MMEGERVAVTGKESSDSMDGVLVASARGAGGRMDANPALKEGVDAGGFGGRLEGDAVGV